MSEAVAKQLRGMSRIYKPDEILRHYIEGGNPFGDLLKQSLESGQDPNAILNQLIDSASKNQPYIFQDIFQPLEVQTQPSVAPAPTGEALPAVQPTEPLGPPTPSGYGFQFSAEDMEQIVAEYEAFLSGEEDKTKEANEKRMSEELDKLPAFLNPQFATPTGLESFTQHPFAGYAPGKPADVAGKLWEEEQKVARFLGSKLGPGFDFYEKQLKKGFVNATRWSGPRIENAVLNIMSAEYATAAIPGGTYSLQPRAQVSKGFNLYKALQELSQVGYLPPKEEYSDDFIKKITTDPHHARFLFLLDEEGSRGSTRGDFNFVSDRFREEHPALTRTGEIASMFTFDEYEMLKDPEHWQYYLLAYAGIKHGLFPVLRKAGKGAIKAGKGALALRRKAIASEKLGARIITWDVGKALGKAAAPFIKAKRPIPLTVIKNVLEGNIADDPFLSAHPIVASAIRWYIRKNPKVVQDMMDFANSNIDNLDDVVYKLKVPRFATRGFDKAEIASGMVGKKHAYQGVLEAIARKGDEQAAILTSSFWSKGIDVTAVSSIGDRTIIEIAGLSDDLYKIFNGLDAPFGTMIMDNRTVIRINKGNEANALRFIDSLKPVAEPIQNRPAKHFRRVLDEMRHSIDPDDFDDIQRKIGPWDIDEIQAVAPEPVISQEPQVAVPARDTGAVTPPAQAQPVIPAVPPSVEATKKVWTTPKKQWIKDHVMPDDYLRVRNHPARINGFDRATFKQQEDYLGRLQRLVKKYTDKGDAFDAAYKRHVPGTGKASDWEPYLQWSHEDSLKAKFAKEIADAKAYGIDNPYMAPHAMHKIRVEKALRAGADVPDEVLADYPDLMAIKAGLDKPPGKLMPLKKAEELQSELLGTLEADPIPPTHEPLPPMSDFSMKNTSELRGLGWTDDQIATMKPDEASKALAGRLTPVNSRIVDGNVKHFPPIRPSAEGVPAYVPSVDELAPIELAGSLLDTMDDDAMRTLRTVSRDPLRGNADDLLNVMAETNEEARKILATYGAGTDSDEVIQSMVNLWESGAREIDTVEKFVDAKGKERWTTYSQDFKDRLSQTKQMFTGDKEHTRLYKLQDPELKDAMKIAQGEDRRWYREKMAAWKLRVNKEVDLLLPDRELRNRHPQFHANVRTKLTTLPSRSVVTADKMIGTIMGDMSKAEQKNLWQILGLRDFLSRQSEEYIFGSKKFSQELLEKELRGLMSTITPRMERAMDDYYEIAFFLGKDLVERGKISAAALRSNYLHHAVRDYTPDWFLSDDFIPSLGTRLQQPFRPETMPRIGTTKDLALTPGVMRSQFAMHLMDNGIEDFMETELNRLDLWKKIAKPGMTDDQVRAARATIFGADDLGNPLPVRHGKRYPVPGSDEDYIGFQFIRGNQVYPAMATTKENIARFMDDLLLIGSDESERLSNLIDPEEIAKGNIPDEIAALLDPAGLRSVMAIGRRNQAQAVPESVYNKVMWFKDQGASRIPFMRQALATI
jgi:hypothetical protein